MVEDTSRDESCRSGAEIHSLSSAEIEQRLEQHKHWLKTKQGKPAEFNYVDFRKEVREPEWGEVNLENAKLSGASLKGANLECVSLKNVDFEYADLTDAKLHGADVRKACFRGANLSGADLSNVRGLSEIKLAHSKLCGAELPEHLAEFDGLQRIAEVTSHANPVLMGIIGACLFSLLTIFSASDLDLIQNAMSPEVPNVGIKIDIISFFRVVPLVLLGMYLYLHFYLYNLWRYASYLPEVFQDGLPLTMKACPWLLNVMFERYRPKLCEEAHIHSDRAYPFLGFAASVFVTWGLVPITLFFFWEQYLVLHDEVITLLLTVCVALAVFFAIDSFKVAVKTLRTGGVVTIDQKDAESESLMKRFAFPLGFTAVTLAALIGFACFVNKGNPGWVDSWLLDSDNNAESETNSLKAWLDSQFYPDLRRRDVSVKEAGWQEYEKHLYEREIKEEKKRKARERKSDGYNPHLVTATTNEKKPTDESENDDAPPMRAPIKRALLRDRNLRGIKAGGVFLFQADLQNADLRWGRFYLEEIKSNLEMAELIKAQLQGADLRGTKFRSAVFREADLKGAKLDWADCRGANFRCASMEKVSAKKVLFNKADLAYANMEDAILIGSDFEGDKDHLYLANVNRANFRETNLSQDQLDRTCCCEETLVPSGLNRVRCLANARKKLCEKPAPADCSKATQPNDFERRLISAFD
jgi:uncharacterized protein YjbI with pentapeptide repeats